MSEVPFAQNPFVGPHPLTRNDAFYGREKELAKLVQLLDARRVVLLHAPSGAGKTSLIQAGLIPQLERDEYHVLPVARLHFMPAESSRFGPEYNRYVYSLILSLEEKEAFDQGGDGQGEQPLPAIHDYLLERLEALDTWAPAALIIDQFEEILKDPIDIEQKVDFFSQLGSALHRLDLWTLFVIRDDFMGSLMDSRYVRHIPTHLVNSFHMDLLSTKAAKHVIKCTAEGCPGLSGDGQPVDQDAPRRKFSDDAVDDLVDNLRRIKVQVTDEDPVDKLGPYVEPVHLQVACRRLWDHLPPETTEITKAELTDYGDVDKALAAFYADEVANICRAVGVDQRDIRYWVQRRLITRKGIRLPVLEEKGQTRGLDNSVLSQLVDAHLLRKETRAGRHFYELAHDRLVEPVLQDNERWFDENLSMLQQRAELWKSGGYPDYLLLSGENFQEAETWKADNSEQMTALDQEFFDASLAEKEKEEAEMRSRQRVERLTRTLGCVTILLLITVVAVIVIVGRQQLQTAAAVAQAAEAEAEKAELSAAVSDSQAQAAYAQGTSIASMATSEALRQSVSQQGELMQGELVQAEATSAAANVNAANVNATAAAAVAGSTAVAYQAVVDEGQASSVESDSRLAAVKATVDARAALNAQATATESAAIAEATIQAANATATAVNTVYALFPAGAEIPIYAGASNENRIGAIEGPERIQVLERQNRYVRLRLPDGGTGWADLYALTYEGSNYDMLGEGLEPLFLSYPPELDFVYGVTRTGYQGLKDPFDFSTPSYWVPGGTEVILLEEKEGDRYYGSGRWVLVYYVEDETVKKTYLPIEAIRERPQE